MAINLMAPKGDKDSVELAERVLANLEKKKAEKRQDLALQKEK